MAPSLSAEPRPRTRSLADCGEARWLTIGRIDQRTLWLQVNKRNTDAIGFYRSAGFEVIREAVMDIGGGFVMDDYLMAKPA